MSMSDDVSAGPKEPGAATGSTPSQKASSMPTAPKYEDVQALRRSRDRRGGPRQCSIPVEILVVTPILGGSPRTRAIDDVDVIRPATVRGHLRFWWRALNGHRYRSSNDLFKMESDLWGRAATEREGGRSAVDLRIAIAEDPGASDDSEIDLGKTPGAYALWPARSEKTTNTPPAPRRKPGTRFRLELRVPSGREEELRSVVRAWLIFGGYGGRTRRGLGSLTVTSDAEAWLPREATREALRDLFREDIFAASGSASETPLLAGAALYIGDPSESAETAWTTALGWLRDFRQGTSGPAGGRARNPGAGGRPSISNWPEADKVRHLSTPYRGLPWAHPPRYNSTPAWPRAGFGLPIIGQFQQQSRVARPSGRQGPRYLHWDELKPPTTEPRGFELRWHDGTKERDRLASPLIVKALPLADGRFVPCALWLNRKYPDGKVVLRDVAGSGAPFDLLLPPRDTAQFNALAGKSTLKEAFLDWLASRAKPVAR